MSLLRRRRVLKPAPKPSDVATPPPASPESAVPAPGPETVVSSVEWAEESPTTPAAPQAIVLATAAPEVDHADGRGKPGEDSGGSGAAQAGEKGAEVAEARPVTLQDPQPGKSSVVEAVRAPPEPAGALATLDDVRPHFGPKQVLEYALSDVSPNTRLAYARDVELFAKWLGTTSEAAVGLLVGRGRGAANALAVDWLNSMRQDELSSATRARRLATLSAIVRAARRLGLVEWAIEVRRPKVSKYRDTRGPTREQAQLMLSACDGGTLEGLRNRAVLLCALTLGLRRSEIAAIRTSHFANGRLSVLGKGDKLKSVEVPEETQRAIDRWLEAWRAAEPESSDDVVFRSLGQATYGAPLGPKGVYDVVSAIGDAVGVHAWPHGLRHTAITVGLEETGGNVGDVATFGRHDDPKVTMQYNDNRRDAASAVAAKLGKVFGS